MFCSTVSIAQDRFVELKEKLTELANTTTPGLNEPVDFSVSGVSIQEFLRGIAETNNLNISISRDINVEIINNFNNEKVINVLLFLCQEYNLEIHFVGSIMSFHNYQPPVVVEPPKPEKEVIVSFNAEEDALTVDLEEDPLHKVVKKITQLSGKNVIVPDGIRHKKVSGYIQKLPFESALKRLAFANNLDFNQTKDGAYYLVEKPEEVVAEDNGRNNGRNGRNGRNNFNIRNNGQGDIGDYDLKITQGPGGEDLITFSAQDAPIVEVIRVVSEQVGASYLLYSEPEGNTSLTVKDLPYNEFLNFVLQGTEHTYRSDSNHVYMIGERGLEGLRANRVVQLEYRSVDEMINMIPAELSKNVQISEFREQNSIVLSGSDPAIQEIVEFLASVDKVVPMVMIEVIIVDLRKTKTFQAGLSAGVGNSPDSSSVGGSLVGSNGYQFSYSPGAINKFLTKLTAGTPINLGQVPPNFYFTLSALDAKNYANVRQMPKLATLNGHEANMSIGRSSYYRVETQNLVGTQNPIVNTTQQWNEVQANLSININPVVSGDDQVTLQIDVELSDFIGAPPENAPPPSATSQFNSMIRVRNEDMIVLGGLERVEKSENNSGIPVLSKIPVLKWVFGHTSKSKNKTVTTIFIKPTILY